MPSFLAYPADPPQTAFRSTQPIFHNTPGRHTHTHTHARTHTHTHTHRWTDRLGNITWTNTHLYFIDYGDMANRTGFQLSWKSGNVMEFCFGWNVRELSGNFVVSQGIFAVKCRLCGCLFTEII